MSRRGDFGDYRSALAPRACVSGREDHAREAENGKGERFCEEARGTRANKMGAVAAMVKIPSLKIPSLKIPSLKIASLKIASHGNVSGCNLFCEYAPSAALKQRGSSV
jgi:hypothetical protein